MTRTIPLLLLLTGCGDAWRDWDLPQQCKGSLESVRARITVPYTVSYVAMEGNRWGTTLPGVAGGPAYIFINKDLGRLNRDVALQHEACHLIAGNFH